MIPTFLRDLAVASRGGPGAVLDFSRQEMARWLLGCQGTSRQSAAWPHRLRHDLDVLSTRVDDLSNTIDAAADIAIAVAPLVSDVADLSARIGEHIVPEDPRGDGPVARLGEHPREEQP